MTVRSATAHTCSFPSAPDNDSTHPKIHPRPLPEKPQPLHIAGQQRLRLHATGRNLVPRVTTIPRTDPQTVLLRFVGTRVALIGVAVPCTRSSRFPATSLRALALGVVTCWILSCRFGPVRAAPSQCSDPRRCSQQNPATAPS